MIDKTSTPGDRAHVLVVDDDEALGMVLVGLLTQAGYFARHVASAEEGLFLAVSSRVDVVLTDVRMPGMDGIQFVREMQKRAPEIPVVTLSAHDTSRNAVEAMKAGAKDFLTKPFDRDELVYTLHKVLAECAATEESPARTRAGAGPIMVRSAAMAQAVADVRRAATSSATVLLRGESGTGKELCARELHALSARRNAPFIVVNAAALPEALLESELFGYERGAFTGATSRKPGRVELAAGGTFMLDEIGDVPAGVQVKLLRLLQDHAFQRLGGKRQEMVDVRFIAATHRNLEALVAAGKFREDLYFRLAVIPIRVPSLRDRVDDIAPLAMHFAQVAARENGRAEVEISPAALSRLENYDWPGNVRELENLVERLILFGDGVSIGEDDVARELGRAGTGTFKRPSPAVVEAAVGAPGEAALVPRGGNIDKRAIVDALTRARGNRSLAARLLKVSRRTLYYKLEDLGIK